VDVRRERSQCPLCCGVNRSTHNTSGWVLLRAYVTACFADALLYSDDGPIGELTFICGEKGNPFTKESFGNAFREACRESGVYKSAHGVRKIGATRAANNGATVAALDAIFGWVGGRMASLYTRSADRARLARQAISKLANNDRTSIAAPGDKVRRPALKN